LTKSGAILGKYFGSGAPLFFNAAVNDDFEAFVQSEKAEEKD
jgi:hypothetical protein